MNTQVQGVSTAFMIMVTTQALIAVARGELDLNELARKELAHRKWFTNVDDAVAAGDAARAER